jgi:[acyl-carrier-protein] S-malonyltransferase
MKKIGLLFAGQGAQAVGMGRDLAENFPIAADLFAHADKILDRKLTDIMWNGSAEALTNTANCQPGLYLHSLAALAVLRQLFGEFPVDSAAGLSLGEITAHAAAGTFDFAEGLRLVQKRGQFMDEACAETLGGMAALIGGQENDVRRLAADEDVDVANINAPGQIVISGELTKVETAIGVAKEYGIRRATLLNVAGAYHSRLMESAYLKLGEVLAEVQMQLPLFAVVSNVTGEEVNTLPQIRQTLQEQVTATVRWSDCLRCMLGRGCELFIELGPGTVLASLLQRTSKEAKVYSIHSAEYAHQCATEMRMLME